MRPTNLAVLTTYFDPLHRPERTRYGFDTKQHLARDAHGLLRWTETSPVEMIAFCRELIGGLDWVCFRGTRLGESDETRRLDI